MKHSWPDSFSYPVFLLAGMVVLLHACSPAPAVSSVDPVNWKKRAVTVPLSDSLVAGATYLSVYSQIYSDTEHRLHDLTATVSMRNISLTDTVYIDRADYYNSAGELVRSYLGHTIFIAPMETVEIVIDEADRSGGTGANFVLDWRTASEGAAPLFEAVMISTSGQQGLSFSTQGRQMR